MPDAESAQSSGGSVPASALGILYPFIDSVAERGMGALSILTYGPVLFVCRNAVLSILSSSLTKGQLQFITADGDRFLVSAEQADPRPAASHPIPEGFAEAYMAGDCDVSDLVRLFKIFIRSQSSARIPGFSTLPSRLFSLVTTITNSRFANTLSNSFNNISAHYDLSNEMFGAFLSADMTYSCGIFKDLDGDLVLQRMPEIDIKRAGLANGHHASQSEEEEDELEAAQMRKIRHIIRKADIRAGHRVLEIGTGWGSFAINAVQSTGCIVDTITLSRQQKVLAEERIKVAGLEGSIRVWLMDYRSLPESWQGQFDRVVSIEMVEAVGKEFIGEYFKMIDTVLEPAGVACIQSITIPESRFESYRRNVDFIQKYIFPGGCLPTVTYLVEQATKGSANRLIVDSIGNIGPHYARTLREWQRRFLARFEDTVKPALLLSHTEMEEKDVEVFKRKWIYYFCYCEAGFAERVLGVHILTFVREGYVGYGCQVFE